jgi:hypothetical protein
MAKKFEEETVNAVATEHVSKFEYYKKPNGGYTNKGVIYHVL